MKHLVNVFLGFFAVVLLLLAMCAGLLVRPSQIAESESFTQDEINGVQSAAAKLGAAFYQGMREPDKKVRIVFSENECAAMLSVLGRSVTHFYGDKAAVSGLENRRGNLAGYAEIKLPLGVIPVRFEVRGAVSGNDLHLTIRRGSAGMVPLPPRVLQKIADSQIRKFKSSDEGRMLTRGVERFEFRENGTLILEATPATCMTLLQTLL